MNASSYLLKILDLCCDEKKKFLIGFRKIRLVFVHVKKIVFGIEKSDLCLLNKTKSFGLKKKNQIFFFRIRKIGFLFVLKNIRSVL